MQFAKQLREEVKRGFITASVRIWTSARVKAGGRYPLEEGEIVVESVEEITLGDVTNELARETGFGGRAELLEVARHGAGERVYLVRFRYRHFRSV